MDADKKPAQLNSPFVTTVMKYAGKAHVWVYRKTGGKIGAKWRVGAGFNKPVPTLLLEHSGRKSGKTFVSPLVYINDGQDVVVVASQGGRDDRPAVVPQSGGHPDMYIEIGTDRRAVHAVTANAEEERARVAEAG